MKGKQIEITGSCLKKVNGRFEVYNTSDDTVHMARINASGRKMAPSAKTLLTLSVAQYEMGVSLGQIREI